MKTQEGGARRAAFAVRECLFPLGCAVCGRGLVNAGEAFYGLCGECRDGIDGALRARLAANALCDLCGKPLVSEQGRCLPCRDGEARSFDRVFAIFPYTAKHRLLLGAYKFGKSRALGNYFTEKIRDVFDGLAAFAPEAVVVPVPPRPGKIKDIGWDQVEYLARLLERGRQGLPVCRCLRRLGSPAQKQLKRQERLSNLHGRIVLAGRMGKVGRAPAGKATAARMPATAVLIDDIMTTGSTMDACASALKAGGAEKVYGICLFYT